MEKSTKHFISVNCVMVVLDAVRAKNDRFGNPRWGLTLQELDTGEVITAKTAAGAQVGYEVGNPGCRVGDIVKVDFSGRGTVSGLEPVERDYRGVYVHYNDAAERFVQYFDSGDELAAEWKAGRSPAAECLEAREFFPFAGSWDEVQPGLFVFDDSAGSYWLERQQLPLLAVERAQELAENSASGVAAGIDQPGQAMPTQQAEQASQLAAELAAWGVGQPDWHADRATAMAWGVDFD